MDPEVNLIGERREVSWSYLYQEDKKRIPELTLLGREEKDPKVNLIRKRRDENEIPNLTSSEEKKWILKLTLSGRKEISTGFRI